MNHKRQTNKTNGFTIVELLIVIVVIAILAVITLTAFSGMQAKARDSERKTDIKTIAKILELYYIDNGFYPIYSNGSVGIGLAAWRSANLPSLRDEAITPPGTSSVTLVNSTTPTIGQYGYHNSGSCVGTQCPLFRLYWRSEVDNTIQTVLSLN